MNEHNRPLNQHDAYHAHVYFNESCKAQAKQLCDGAGQRFNVEVGRFHEQLVGPHPMWSCQIFFESHQFDEVIPWLDEHRQGLTILVHGLTGSFLADHTHHAYWLGDSVKLKLETTDI